MATKEQIEAALRKADAAGNVEDAAALAKAYRDMVAKENETMTWADAGKAAATNLPSSLIDVVTGTAKSLVRPIDTASELADIAAGGLRNVMPEGFVSANDKLNAKLGIPAQDTSDAQAKADAVGKFYADRYGSTEGLKQAIAKDPAGVLMDASGVIGGAGFLAGKIPGASAASKALINASDAVNPINATIKLIGKTGKLGGKAASTLIGEFGTHTGRGTIDEAFLAGVDKYGGSGSKSDVFQGAINGNIDANTMVDQLRSALKDYSKGNFNKYLTEITPILQSTTPLDWTGVDAAVRNVLARDIHKGIDINSPAASTREKIANLLTEFKAAGLDRPEDFDALKRGIGNIYSSTEPHTSQRTMASEAYAAARKAITDVLPEYGKVMKDSEQGLAQVWEIEKGLSLGEKSMKDTALRKLFSITRNNANTNFGNRQKLLDVLTDMPQAKGIKSELAGHALSSIAPRGLGKLISAGTLGSAAALRDPYLASTLLLQSPYIMGQSAYGLGVAKGAADKVGGLLMDKFTSAGINPVQAQSVLYQSQQPKKENR